MPPGGSLGDALCLHHQVAQARARRDVYFEVFLAFGTVLGEQFFIGRDARLGLGLARLGAHADPFQLALERFLALALGLFLQPQSGLFLLQPGRIVALPGDAPAAVQLQNPAGDIVQEIAVVRHGDHRSGVVLEMMFEPGDGFGIEMVGGLVQKQDVRLAQQQAAERHPPPLAAGDDLDRGVSRRAAQRVHGHFKARVEIPGIQCFQFLLNSALAREDPIHFFIRQGLGQFLVDAVKLIHEIHRFLDSLFHHLAHGFGVIQLRFLLQQAHGQAGG